MSRVPGKIFLFGEYSVMNGGEAVVVAVTPEFEKIADSSVHPDSPAGKFMLKHSFNTDAAVIGGLGAGFGSSTAELIFANDGMSTPLNELDLWTWYREHHLPASGADLAVQLHSSKWGLGAYHFQLNQDRYRINKVETPHLFWKNCFLFQCPPDQKIPTYSDLENRKQGVIRNADADTFVHRWLKTRDFSLFNEWAEYLSEKGFESVFASEVRRSFQSIEGVVGVKGCGAGLNDVFLIGIGEDDPRSTFKKVMETADRHGLRFIGSMDQHV